MAKKIYTLHDARNERHASKSRGASVADVRAMTEAADARVMADHPHIGKLVRNGRPVYYVTAPSYREATRALDLV